MSRVPAKGPEASSVNLASLMIAQFPSPSQAVQLAERQQQLQQALDEYLNEATERIIREEVFGDTTDAGERAG